MSNLRSGKRLPIFAVISALIVIAGAVLFGLFGFHRISEAVKSVEVSYDAIITISNGEEKLESLCEKAFSDQGLKVKDKSFSVRRESNTLGETGDKLIRYEFSSNASEEALKRAVESIRANAMSEYGEADVYAAVFVAEEGRFYESAWRGAIALAVAAIAALIYLGFRYGVGCALSGLAAVCNSALMTLALFAIFRIPVYAYGPLVFAGIASAMTVLLWIIFCAKLRAQIKDQSFAALTAEEAVLRTTQSSYKEILLFTGISAAVFVVLGAVASAGARLFFLPALIPLAVSLYSSVLLAPAVLVPLKNKFDRMKASRKRYEGKKKAENAENAE